MTHRPIRLGRLLAGSALLAFGCAAGPALAQEAPAGAETAPGEVVVTGSRIAHDTYDTASPTVTVSKDDLQESGDSELSETLADLPQLSSPLNDSSVTGNTQNSGLSSIQLRGLGDNRTLVLIDGRRTVSNSGIGNRVSLSTIPSDFVDRVEIVTGGTSSVYGSDAIAGVVNIITESRQRGFRINTRTGITGEGDGQEFTLNGSWGTRFADKRGYFLISGTYDRDWGIRATDREWATRPAAYSYDFTTGTNEFETVYDNGGVPTSGSQPAGTFPPNVLSDLSSYISGGVFSGGNSARDRFYVGNQLVPLGPDVQTGKPISIGTTDNGNTGYFLPNRDGYNQRTGRSLILPRTRYLAAAKLDYEFSDAVQAFAQVQYSRIYSTETRESYGIGWDSTYPLTDPVTGITTEVEYGKIPCLRAPGPCNPYIPAELRGSETPSTGVGIAWDRRFDEVGGQITENDRETVRSWAGLRGQLSKSWNWEASFGYGQYRQDQWRRNEINGQHLTEALNAEQLGDGTVQCVSAAARAEGCVPVNLFGAGSITPQAADWIRADLHQDLTIRQYTGQAFVTGDLLQLPAGPVGAAFGIDFRRDSQELRGDTLSQTGGTTGNAIPDFGGSITAFEGYGELSVPILKDKPFAYRLELDGSARVAHYDIDRVGTVFSYRAGAQYAPVEDIRFRVQYARAQRAPDIAELFSPPRGNFEAANDLCDGVRPSTTGRIAENCRKDPGIQALFAEQAGAGETQRYTQQGNNLYSPNGGNPDLKEETADTLTLGAVFTPTFIRGLSLAVDYYDIRIKDAIDAYSNTDIQTQCYDTDTPQDENPFCADITRNANNGQIVQLVQRQVNLAGFDTTGIDVAFNYNFGLDRLIGVPGKFDLRYDATHVLKQKVTFQGIDGTVVNDYTGDLTQGSFKYRARGSIGWQYKGLRLRWTTTYYGKIHDSNLLADQYAELLATVPDAEVPTYLNIGDVFEHDIYVGVDVNAGRTKFRLYGGVNNLFDSISPFLPSGTESGRLTNQNGIYDIAGRRFYIGATLRF